MDKKRKRQLLQDREDAIAQLYQECVSVKEISKWSQFEPIYEKLQRVMDVEKDLSKVNSTWTRGDQVNTFLDWLHGHGVDTSNFEISPFDNYGFGLKARRDLQLNECFLTVPLSVIITTDTVMASPAFGPLVSNDQLLRSMPNVALALFLLHERSQTQWKAYLDVLPTRFETPLYFNCEQLIRLKSSAALCDVLTHIQRIARQYCYLHNLLKSHVALSKLAEQFSYDAYRWAVSAVSTRQNNILNKNGEPQLALIPLMDFLNHQYGQECVHYDLNLQQIECTAMTNIEKNDQIFMFYGKRTNAEYFIHNGFVPNQTNPHDSYLLKLALPKTDKAFEEKHQLLQRYGLEASEKFVLLVDDDLLNPAIFIFIKIFLMSAEDTLQVLSKNLTMDAFFDDYALDRDGEVRKFLQTRLQLFIRSLNRSTLNQNDSIDALLISEHELLTKAWNKLDLPFENRETQH